MVCLLLFSVGGVQSSIQLSVGFRVYSVQYQVSVCSLQGMYCSVGHSPVYSSVSAVFRALAVHHESVTFMSCSESTLWRSSAPAQFLNFNIPSATEGHLKTKQNVKIKLKSTYLSLHNDTRFGTYLRGLSETEVTGLGVLCELWAKEGKADCDIT